VRIATDAYNHTYGNTNPHRADTKTDCDTNLPHHPDSTTRLRAIPAVQLRTRPERLSGVWVLL
jgi:hypothetical protein